MSTTKVIKLLRACWRLPRRRKLILAEAVYWLTVARICHLMLPFKRFSSVFGLAGASSPQEVEPATSEHAFEICHNIDRISRVLPFETLCLQQAFAAKKMLSRRGILATTYLGVHKDRDQRYSGQSGTIAHAWIRVGRDIVIVGETVSNFVPIASFSDTE